MKIMTSAVIAFITLASFASFSSNFNAALAQSTGSVEGNQLSKQEADNRDRASALSISIISALNDVQVSGDFNASARRFNIEGVNISRSA
jgi:hypothetical protein